MKDHPLDPWALRLGKLVSSLQGLEFILRAFLYERVTPAALRFPFGHSPYADPVGTLVPTNPLTDYATLGDLIRRYNSYVGPIDPSWQIENDVVGIRDALAHGRVSSSTPGDDLELIKYLRPSKSAPETVRVSVRFRLTSAWLEQEIVRTQQLTLRVLNAHKDLPKPATA